MANETKYPARGEMSEDGKLYTDDVGAVHERVKFTTCHECSLNVKRVVAGCRIAPCCSDMFKRIPGAHVPSADEQAACDMARAMILLCITDDKRRPPLTCRVCAYYIDKSCPARAYLAAHGDGEKAWEVAT